jgi:hypothetical protein
VLILLFENSRDGCPSARSGPSIGGNLLSAIVGINVAIPIVAIPRMRMIFYLVRGACAAIIGPEHANSGSSSGRAERPPNTANRKKKSASRQSQGLRKG